MRCQGNDGLLLLGITDIRVTSGVRFLPPMQHTPAMKSLDCIVLRLYHNLCLDFKQGRILLLCHVNAKKERGLQVLRGRHTLSNNAHAS